MQAIFFWTRWPVPLMPHLDLLDQMGHRYIFHFTLTGLGPPLESQRPTTQERIDAFRALADRIGHDRVWWRYDPIIMGDRLDADYHCSRFHALSEALEGATNRVTLSLLDWYRKTERRITPLEADAGSLRRLTGPEPEVLELVTRLGQMARSRGITPVACCEPAFQDAGIQPGACIDAAAANRIFGLAVKDERDNGQRERCCCAPSFDIGAAHTCISDCAYCYSTVSQEVALRNFARHDPQGEFLHNLNR